MYGIAISIVSPAVAGRGDAEQRKRTRTPNTQPTVSAPQRVSSGRHPCHPEEPGMDSRYCGGIYRTAVLLVCFLLASFDFGKESIVRQRRVL
jgi:hypothetical protein